MDIINIKIKHNQILEQNGPRSTFRTRSNTGRRTAVYMTVPLPFVSLISILALRHYSQCQERQ